MKQSIYYMRLTDGTEILSITRIDAVEKVNTHYVNEKHYKPITMAVLDRLIMTGKRNSFIERTAKQPSNEYYKEEIDLFIKNDKKDRTEDALKKAISRYVNKLFYGGGEIKQSIKTNKIVNSDLGTLKNDTNNIIDIITDETDITEDKIINVVKTDNTLINDLTTENNDLTTELINTEAELETQIITYETKPINDISNDEIKTIDTIDDEIKTLDISNEEIKTIKLYEDEDEEIINSEDVLKQLCNYLGEYNLNNDISNVRLYYENNKDEVETAYKNKELELNQEKKIVKAKKKRKKNIYKSFKTSIKKQKQNKNKSTIKK